jgi:hypothetical protein
MAASFRSNFLSQQQQLARHAQRLIAKKRIITNTARPASLSFNKTAAKMASVYKSVSNQKSNGKAHAEDDEGKPKNRQRLLILSSRGVTYR